MKSGDQQPRFELMPKFVGIRRPFADLVVVMPRQTADFAAARRQKDL
jgi:hypothetical protein